MTDYETLKTLFDKVETDYTLDGGKVKIDGKITEVDWLLMLNGEYMFEFTTLGELISFRPNVAIDGYDYAGVTIK